MPNLFKLGEAYTGADIIKHLDSDSINKNSKEEWIEFEKGLELRNSDFILEKSNVMTHKDLNNLKDKLDYYVVKYEYVYKLDEDNDLIKEAFIPKIQAEIVIPTISHGKSEPFVIDKDLRRCYLNYFLINKTDIGGYISNFLVYEADGVTPVRVYEDEETVSIDKNTYYKCFCDLIPGNKYILKNTTSRDTINGYYIVIEGEEW